MGEERGDGVEEADIGGEGDEDEVECWIAAKQGNGFAQGGRGVGGGGGDWCWGLCGDEEGGEGGDGGDESDVERHGGDVGGFRGEEGGDELT